MRVDMSEIEIEMDPDEFSTVIKYIDEWERLMCLKFVEAEVEEKVVIKAVRVATPSFFLLLPDKKLMVEVTKGGRRVGYIDVEELAEFDEELLERVKTKLLKEKCEVGDGRYFPVSEDCVELFKRLMKTAR
jgi:hypothetical protein